MRQVVNHRSRLARQENKQMAKQTVIILVAAVIFIVLFFWIGIPSLINLAVALGNSKAASKFNQETDTIPPAPPQVNIIPVATTSANLDISGSAEAGTTIYLYQDNTKAQETTADNLGNFAFLNLTLADGSTSFYTQSIDSAGNQSHNSTVQIITFDNQPPQLEITQPTDGSRFYGVTEQFIDIAGQTDPAATVFLNDRQLVVTGDGAFATKQELREGDNQLKFIATDEAGNKTETEISVNFSR